MYHIWLDRVSGGVDVFFVVTGFFITAMLLRDAESGRIRPLRFLGRLIRRLWPAATLVLLTSLLLVYSFLPAASRRRNLEEIRASALYVENWFLSSRAIDYLDAADPPSIAQHFWALSLQGQFYLAWLAVFAIAVLCSRSDRTAVRAKARQLVCGIGIASFAYSVWLTSTNQPVAYFVTTTRLWEFCVGAAIALIGSRAFLRGTAAACASSGALAALVLCGLVLPVGSSFPGWAALVPVGAAALLLMSTRDDERPWAGTRLLAAPPLVWLGARSYGIYLWHWPFLVVAREITEDRKVSFLVGAAIIACAIMAAVATHALLERPVAARGGTAALRRRTTATLVAAMIIVVVISTLGLARQDAGDQAAAARSDQLREEAGDCFGAGALLDRSGRCDDILAGEPVVPERSNLLNDTSSAYDCYTQAGATSIARCTLGPTDAETRIAVVGNSHAAMLLPLLESQAEARGWSIDPFVGNGCVLGNVTPATNPACTDKLEQTRDAILNGEYDYAVFHGGRGGAGATHDDLIEAWSEIEESGTPVVAVEDNPRIGSTGRDCIARSTDAALLAGECDVPRGDGLAEPDRYVAAAQATGVEVVETIDLYCDETTCPATIGNVVVYRDEHHVTATYIVSATELVERLHAALQSTTPSR